MFSYQITLTLAIIVLMSPLYIHELGHWAALRKFDVPVIRYWIGLGPVLFKLGNVNFGLFPIGAAIGPEPEKFNKLSARQRFIVAMAGPLASAVAGLILFLSWCAARGAPGFTPLLYCAALNLFIAVLNLLPIPPLDGFHALTAWLEHRGTVMSAKVTLWSQKMGSAVIYGAGAYFLTSYVVQLLAKASQQAS